MKKLIIFLIFILFNSSFAQITDTLKNIPFDRNNHRVSVLYSYNKETGAFVPVKTDSKGAFDVFIQDQTSLPIESWLSYKMEDATLQSDVLIDTRTVVLDPIVSSIAGSSGYYLEVAYYDSVNSITRHFQGEIINVVTTGSESTIDLDKPLDFTIETEYVESIKIVDANAARVSSNALPTNILQMSVTPPDHSSWDLTRLMVTGITASDPGDGQFLGGPPLTYGIYFGFTGESSLYLANVKVNAGFRVSAFDVAYTTRSDGQGNYGISVRKTFAGQDKYGVAIRLNAKTNDTFAVFLQEDFSTNAIDLRFKIMGHVVEE